MLKEISSVFTFLTIIPGTNSNLETVAKYMYIFPIVGILVGLIIGSFALGLSLFLEPLIVALLVVAGLAIITGIHHTDGLADFADGLMTKGNKEKKIKIYERCFNWHSRNCINCTLCCWNDSGTFINARISAIYSNFT